MTNSHHMAGGLLIKGSLRRHVDRPLATEVPVALVYNGLCHVVMLATPADIPDLALGFSLSEGIIAGPEDLLDLDVVHLPEGIEARMTVTARRFAALNERRRFLAGRTGCGLCGIETLAAANRALPRVPAAPPVAVEAIRAALAALPGRQGLNAETGAVHAAAWADIEGRLLCVREDVGRHNALDKLVGALLAAEIDRAAGFALLTSRCSYELVEKAAQTGIGLLVAISAPTERALAAARASGVCVVALARADSMIVFTGAERIA